MKKAKERLRTIQLDQDVSKIAQKLADQKKLSSTLSELLRVNFGFGSALEEKKRELHNLLDYKQTLIDDENRLVNEIEKMESEYLDKSTNVKPILEDKLKKLQARISMLQHKAKTTIDAADRQAKYRGIEALEKQMQEIRLELDEINSAGVL